MQFTVCTILLQPFNLQTEHALNRHGIMMILCLSAAFIMTSFFFGLFWVQQIMGRIKKNAKWGGKGMSSRAKAMYNKRVLTLSIERMKVKLDVYASKQFSYYCVCVFDFTSKDII